MAEGDQIHPIMEVPEEVRGAIFNKLPQHDALNLRLVCKQWQHDVDNYFDFNIRLDDRWPYVEKMMGLRIKKCKVLVMKTSALYEKPESIFKHPLLLQTLETRTEHVDAERFKATLKSSTQYIRSLTVERKTIFIDLVRFIKWLPSNDFKNLRVLEIVVHGQGGDYWARGQNGNKWIDNDLTTEERNLIQSFAIPIMPNLQSLKFQLCRTIALSMNQRGLNKSLKVSILRLIAINWTSLKSIDLEFPSVEEETVGFDPLEVSQQSNLSTPESQLCKRIESLSELKIRSSFDKEFPLDFWTELVEHQKKLVDLNLHLPQAGVTFFMCRQVVFNNMDTLVCIDIIDLNVMPNDENVDVDADKGQPFDLSVFQNCASLRTLKLGRCDGPLYHRTRSPLVPEIINLATLPQDLVQLEIRQFLADTTKMLTYCSNLSSNFRKLALFFCGHEGSFGVNGSGMEAILQNDNLTEAIVGGFNFCGGSRIKMQSVLLQIKNWNDDDGAFRDIHTVDLRREDTAWKVRHVFM